jgi:hypothetical protein
MYGDSCKFAHMTSANNGNIASENNSPISSGFNSNLTTPSNATNASNAKQSQAAYDQQTLNFIINGGNTTTVPNNGFTFSIHNIPNTINGQEVCRFYAKTGRCKYGAACKFVHINGGGLGNSNLNQNRHHHHGNNANNINNGNNNPAALVNNSDNDRNNLLNIASNQLPAGISREVLATLLNSLTSQQLASLTQLAQANNQTLNQQNNPIANGLLNSANRDGAQFNNKNELNLAGLFGLAQNAANNSNDFALNGSGFNLSKSTPLLSAANNANGNNNNLHGFNQYNDLLGSNNPSTSSTLTNSMNYRPLLSATTGAIPALGVGALNNSAQHNNNLSAEFDDGEVDLLLPKDLKEENGLGLANHNNNNPAHSQSSFNISSLNDALPSLSSYMSATNHLQLERSNSLNALSNLTSHNHPPMNSLLGYRSQTGNIMDLLNNSNSNFNNSAMNLLNGQSQPTSSTSPNSGNNMLLPNSNSNNTFSAGAFSTGFGRSLTSFNTAPVKPNQQSLQATIANTLQTVSANANLACLKCGSTPSVYNQGFRSLCWRCCPCIHCGENEGKAVCAIGLCENCYIPYAGDRLR